MPYCFLLINALDVKTNAAQLKSDKHDGFTGHFTDHIKHASDRYLHHLSSLLNGILSHAVVPDAFNVSTIIPIPKNKRKSLNNSENYRAIALSSVIGKLLEKIILSKCCEIFKSSMYQYGYKEGHSTMHCSFVVNETIKHYSEYDSCVYVAMLDASKAFDRLHYGKLFNRLITKGLCPIITHFLFKMYNSQVLRVKWCNSFSRTCAASNGVKQGGVLSPLLFTLYLDELLAQLKSTGFGCHIGSTFAGCFAYADDVVLLSPTLFGLKQMLHACSMYSKEYLINFNPEKSKIIVCNKPAALAQTNPTVCFNGKCIEVANEEKHLGTLLGNVSCVKRIDDAVHSFLTKVNHLKCHFKTLPVHTMYTLFKTHCMSLYSSPMWDLSHPSITTFHVAWRKAIRKVLDLPYRTHSRILNLICDDLPIDAQLHVRFHKFLVSLHTSSNPVTQLCTELALSGSGSSVSNNISSLSTILNMSRTDTVHCNSSSVHSKFFSIYSNQIDPTMATHALLIHDLLNMKFDAITNRTIDLSDICHSITFYSLV